MNWRRLKSVDNLAGDLEYAMRSVTKHPAFAIAVVATLALGLGVTTTVFSVVNAVVIRRLPFERPDQLVAVWERDERSTQVGSDRSEIAPANFADWQRSSRTLAALASYTVWSPALTEGGEPENVAAATVSPSFMTLLGTRPLAGRTFIPADAEPTAEHVVMLSEPLWRRRFGADPGIVDRLLRIDDVSYRVVGILPAGRGFPRATQLWTAAQTNPKQNATRSAHYLHAIGRLRDGASIHEAQAELTGIARRLQAQFPESNAGVGVNLVPLQDEITGSVGGALVVLFGAVACLLLIACANVGGLFMARSAARESELALRIALGANRARVIQQVFVESLLLSLAGAVLGILSAVWVTQLVVAVSPVALEAASGSIRVDRTVVAFATALAVGTALAFAVFSSGGLVTDRLADRLAGAGRRTSSRPGESRHRRLLVSAEVALTMMLLAGAGLMFRTLAELHRVDLGFAPTGLVAIPMRLPASRYPAGSHADRVFARISSELRSIPGVRSVAAVFMLPFGRDNRIYSFRKVDRPDKQEQANFRVATAGYFATMRIPLLRGRDFAPSDTDDGPPVVIINESMARRFWPNEPALGRRIVIRNQPVAAEVIGVVGDMKYFGHDSPAEPEMYVPHAQTPVNAMTIVLRTTGGAPPIDALVAERVHAVDRELPIGRIAAMTSLIDDALAVRRFTRSVLAAFAGLALLLSCLGLFALIAYSVTRRTTEIGIRMALGARSVDILRLVTGEGIRIAGWGVVAGVGGAVTLGRVLSSYVFGVSSSDPLVLGSAAAAIASAAVIASVVPAAKAAAVAPARVLSGS